MASASSKNRIRTAPRAGTILTAELERNARLLQMKPPGFFRTPQIGQQRTLVRGEGWDFREIREYQVGDEIRHIDWQATARTGTTCIKTFHEDRSFPISIVVDKRPSMFGGTSRRKIDLALQTMSLITLGLSHHRYQVDLFLFDTNHYDRFIVRNGFAMAQHTLRKTIARTSDVDYFENEPGNVDVTLGKVAAQMGRAGVCIFISDFYFGGSGRVLKALSRRHRFIPIRIRDHLEVYLQENPDRVPFMGWWAPQGIRFWSKPPAPHRALAVSREFFNSSPRRLDYQSDKFTLEQTTHDILGLDRL